MTTQELYNKVLKGDVTESKFLYEVRRDVNLPFITSWNNFKDTIKILKNKGIIHEEKKGADVLVKTIDQVNPYEYANGMDYELGLLTNSVGNRVADNAGDSMHVEDLTKDDMLKAQNKVLKNLTKDQSYYSNKLSMKMAGESGEMEEVTDKVIQRIQKDAKKNNKKFIREHGEDHTKVDAVMGSLSQLEKKGDTDAKRADDAKRLGKKGEENIFGAGVKKGEEVEKRKLTKEEDGEMKLFSKDVESPDKYEVEKLGQTREEIYEKYAQKAGMDVNELKDRLEAYKAQKEEMEPDMDAIAQHTQFYNKEGKEMEESALGITAGVAALLGGSIAADKIMTKLEKGDFGDKGKEIADMLRGLGSAAAGTAQSRNFEAITVDNEDDAIKVQDKDPNADVILKKS